MTARDFYMDETVPAKEDDIASAEKALGARLPDDFRRFLLEYGGGAPNKPCYLGSGGEQAYVQYIFQVSDPPGEADLVEAALCHPAPEGSLGTKIPVALEGQGFILVDSVGGEVYLWHDGDWDGEEATITRLCGSWSELVSGLREDFDENAT